MDIGQTITTTADNQEYRITKVCFGHEDAYREVYLAESTPPGKAEPEEYKLVVYDPDHLRNTRYKKIPEMEAKYASAFSSCVFFEILAGTLQDAVTDTGDEVQVIVLYNDYKTVSLRRYLAEYQPSDDDRWAIIMMLVTAINYIRNQTHGHHFGLSPDCLRVGFNSEGQLGDLIIENYNLISDDYDLDQAVDPHYFSAAYRAPETYTFPFTPKSVQFTLAVLIVYILKGVTPWAIDDDANSSVACRTMREHEPKVDIADERLRAVLIKALSPKPAARFDTFNDFINALDIKYEFPFSPPSLYNDPKDQPKPVKSEDTNSNERDPEIVDTDTVEHIDAVYIDDKDVDIPDIDDDDTIDEFDDKFGSHDDRNPRINVKISRRRGRGFKDVAGMAGIKDQLKRDFVDIYKHREMATKYNLHIPACILFGPPGCGKTYIAQKLAEEMHVDFATINPSDFANIYIHGSQMLMRQFFDKAVQRAQKSGGVLVFMDEVDSICPLRSDSQSGQSGEVAEMLTLLNDLAKKNVWIVAATNSLDRVDPAILRAGRIDKAIYVPMPDAESRKQLFAYELAKVPHDEDIDLDKLSSLTDGHTSSDISYIVNECARIKFAEVVDNECESPIKIDQAVVEKVISETRPSVSKSELAQYEDMRQRYATTRKPRRSLGFQP